MSPLNQNYKTDGNTIYMYTYSIHKCMRVNNIQCVSYVRWYL